MSFRGFCCLLFALVPVYLCLAACVPPFDDEFYYWCWSRDLQLSYYDHPPLVAYMIRAATELFGDSILAIRLPAVVSATVVAAVVGWLCRDRALLPCILLSPALTFAAIMVTPDTPMLMFWALYLAWLVRVHERLATHPDSRVGLWFWLLGGLLLGCGVLGKYTTGLAAVCGGISFLFACSPRRWAFGYVVHAVVSVLVASPILIHNIQYDFVPIRYQWQHSMSSSIPGLAPFGEFVGVQILLFGAVPFVVFVWTIRHRHELLADPRLRVCACLFVIPFAFFLMKATRGRLEGNWAFPCYLACWPLAAEWYSRARESRVGRWGVAAAFALPLFVSTVFAFHTFGLVPMLPPAIDRPALQTAKMNLAATVAADLRDSGYTGPVYAPTYQWTAILRWHGIDAHQLDGFSRPSHFTEHGNPRPTSGRVLMLLNAPKLPAAVPRLGVPRPAACYPLECRGRLRELCWLMEFDPLPDE